MEQSLWKYFEHICSQLWVFFFNKSLCERYQFFQSLNIRIRWKRYRSWNKRSLKFLKDSCHFKPALALEKMFKQRIIIDMLIYKLILRNIVLSWVRIDQFFHCYNMLSDKHFKIIRRRLLTSYLHFSHLYCRFCDFIH